MAFAASTATPARNLPGAFYQTPATTRTTTVADPTRRRLFPEASRGGGSVFGSNPFPPANTTPSRGSGSLAVSSRGSGALVATGDDNGDGAAPEPTQLTPLQNAARAVNYNLKLDESFPELDSYCRRTCWPLRDMGYEGWRY